MTWQLVRLNDVAPTPWRNAGGTTRELLAWPDSAAWQWRASVAEVVQSGPFSRFAGVQRWFAVLGGEGVCLTVDGISHRLVPADAPLAFDGAAITACALLGGATQDFNLMLQGGLSARMLRVKGSFKMTTRIPKILAFYTHNDKASVQVGSDIYQLSQHEFGWLHAAADCDVRVLSSAALFMEIDV